MSSIEKENAKIPRRVAFEASINESGARMMKVGDVQSKRWVEDENGRSKNRIGQLSKAPNVAVAPKQPRESR